ncbi:MAG: ParB/RepB/Spo0J family partition protein [Planctomycetota bacterium]
MSKRTKARLGKGLSGLINQPVPIDPADTGDTNAPDKKVSEQIKAPATSSNTMPFPERPIEVASGGDQRDASGEPPASVSLPDGRRMRAIDVDTIEANPYQPRKAFDADALERLASSITQSGVIQPVAVRTARGESGKAWEIIAGERRWRAARKAGLKKIPAVVVDLSERESAEWALVENLQREDLDPVERADALKALADRFALTHQQIADQVGLDRATVSNLIRLADLEPEIRMLLTSRGDDRISAGHAKALLGMEGGDARIDLARRCAREQWSVRALERTIAERKADPRSGGGPGVPKAPAARHPSIVALERELSEALSTKVSIETNAQRTKGRMVISFFSPDDFESLCERLGIPPASI